MRGKGLASLQQSLTHLGRGGQLPHWYENLRQDGSLPNLDGKTIGTVVEMLFVAVLETETLAGLGVGPLHIKPARGIDLPDLDLGVKSPSENYCTSEPYYSPYERLIGGEYDAVVFLTDYQTAKKKPPLKLQILSGKYLTKSQLADFGLCRVARTHRQWLSERNESWGKKVMRFLAYVNQSDWKAKRLLSIIEHLQEEDKIREKIAEIEAAFLKENKRRASPKKGSKQKPLLSQEDLDAIKSILAVSPLHVGLIDALDNWIVEHFADAARLPIEMEWQRLLLSPLDGEIGLSFALQWRYNFGRLFGASEKTDEEPT